MQMEEKFKAINWRKYFLLNFKTIWKEWVSLYVAFSHIYASMLYSKWSLYPIDFPIFPSALQLLPVLIPWNPSFCFHNILYSNYLLSFLVPQCYSPPCNPISWFIPHLITRIHLHKCMHTPVHIHQHTYAYQIKIWN